FEDVLQCFGVARAVTAEVLGYVNHVVDGFIHPHEESDFNIRSDIVLTDQSVVLHPGNFNFLDRNIHDLHPVEYRNDIHSFIESDLRAAHTGTYNGFSLWNLFVEHAEYDKKSKDKENNGTYGN